MTADIVHETGLAVALRQQTQLAHEQAENAEYMGALLAGELPLDAYGDLVAQNYAIYVALERVTEFWRGDPVAGAFVLDELRRVPSLQRDLFQLFGDDWPEQARRRRVPATEVYVNRLLDVARSSATAFIAHHYVRYLGDLSGGQVVRTMIERIYGATGLSATRFYTFDSIAAIKPFRDAYRDLLDNAPLDSDDRHRVVDEAIVAFQLNQAVSADLAERHAATRRDGGENAD